MLTTTKRLVIILLAAVLLLIVPFIAMQFTNQVNWSGFDFLIMGILLFGVGLSVEMILRKVKKIEPRILLIVGIIALFLLVWAELAIGILGTPLAGS